MKQLILLFALFILFTSFQPDTTDQPAFYHTKWVLNSIHEKNKTEYIYTGAFLQFDDEKNRVSGNGSCNSFGGSMEVSGEDIKFGNLFSTKMYCAEVREIESLLFRQLEKVNRYEMKGKRLLFYNDDQLLLIFSA